MSDTKNVIMVFAPGFEEVEALTCVDLLRRVGVTVKMVSLNGEKLVVGARNITVQMDEAFSEVNHSETDAILLPGGLPGTTHLRNSESLKTFLIQMNADKRWIGAICAAPTVLIDCHVADGKAVTSYPDFEGEFKNSVYRKESVVRDGNIITSRGVGTAIDFALEFVRVLVSEDAAEKLAAAIVYSE